MLLKNVWFTALDVGGRILPERETADLDPGDPVIAEHLTVGRLEPDPDHPSTPTGGEGQPARKTTRKQPAEES